MKISQTDLEELLIAGASKVVDAESAEYFAKESIETHLRKIPRNNPIKTSISDLLACISNKETPIEYTLDLGASLTVDFHGHGPLVYIKQIHDEIEKRTEENGIALVSIKNSQGLHTLHAWVQGLAKRGIVAIVSANGGPEAVVPHNGTRGVFGTNPFAYGIPGEDGEIYCVDMATSEAPFFEIMNAHRAGKDLRPGIAVDDEGNPTTKTSEALDVTTSADDPVANLLPMGGGYKGYNFVYLLELMTSGLIGSPSSPEMSNDFIPEEHGAIIIALNPKALGTESTLLNSVLSINTALSEQTPKSGTKIQTPGQRNNEKLIENKDSEIDIDDELLQKLKSV
jgi:LDH2 family malate/lactate/ureidoglycolate dehydrogenase